MVTPPPQNLTNKLKGTIIVYLHYLFSNYVVIIGLASGIRHFGWILSLYGSLNYTVSKSPFSLSLSLSLSLFLTLTHTHTHTRNKRMCINRTLNSAVDISIQVPDTCSFIYAFAKLSVVN